MASCVCLINNLIMCQANQIWLSQSSYSPPQCSCNSVAIQTPSLKFCRWNWWKFIFQMWRYLEGLWDNSPISAISHRRFQPLAGKQNKTKKIKGQTHLFPSLKTPLDFYHFLRHHFSKPLSVSLHLLSPLKYKYLQTLCRLFTWPVKQAGLFNSSNFVLLSST